MARKHWKVVLKNLFRLPPIIAKKGVLFRPRIESHPSSFCADNSGIPVLRSAVGGLGTRLGEGLHLIPLGRAGLLQWRGV